MIQRKKLFATFVRFGMVGVLATALHYGLYYLLHFIMGANAAFTVGYLLGFVANFYLTSYFTFGTSPSWRKLFGMGGAHAVNYLLQIGLLNFFLWTGGRGGVGSSSGLRHHRSREFHIGTFRIYI